MFNEAALTVPPNVPYELALINPVTVVLPDPVTPEIFNEAALTVPPNVPYELTLTNPVTVVLPSAAVLLTVRAPLTVVPPTTFNDEVKLAAGDVSTPVDGTNDSLVVDTTPFDHVPLVVLDIGK